MIKMAGTLLIRSISRLHFERRISLSSNNRISLYSSFLNGVKVNNNNVRAIQRFKSTKIEENEALKPVLTTRQKLQKAVAEYGSTVIVFHVGISLISLGGCYILVSSGFDATKVIAVMGISGETATRIASSAGTFAVAYGVHKVFAPVRIAITLTATPFIVRYLRSIGVLKKVK